MSTGAASDTLMFPLPDSELVFGLCLDRRHAVTREWALRAAGSDSARDAVTRSVCGQLVHVASKWGPYERSSALIWMSTAKLTNDQAGCRRVHVHYWRLEEMMSSNERRMTVIEVTAEEDAKLADIKRRWTDQAVLVREGFPTGVLAHHHVAFLLDLIERDGVAIDAGEEGP